jgi:molybdate transport system ATP-binding protein
MSEHRHTIEFSGALPRPAFTLDVAFASNARLTALFGASGSGKSTVLAMIAGLQKPARGRIAIDGVVLLDTGKRIALPPHRRRVGFVFQDAHLLPHLSVRSNLGYGRFFTPQTERRIAFEPVVEALGIGHLLERRPGTLSGGERQRVAIGRALIASPRILLMDEPLAALDAERRLEVLPLIERVRDAFAIPIVYVSHSADEVARLAGHVVRLADGRVVAAGTPAEVLAPATLSHGAARFDALSMLTARVTRRDAGFGVTQVEHPAGEIVLPWDAGDVGTSVRVAVRATNVTLARERPANISVRSALTGTVAAIATGEGPFALVTIALRGGDTLFAYATRLAVEELGLKAGGGVVALVKTVALDERGITGLRVVEGST